MTGSDIGWATDPNLRYLHTPELFGRRTAYVPWWLQRMNKSYKELAPRAMP